MLLHGVLLQQLSQQQPLREKAQPQNPVGANQGYAIMAMKLT